MVCAKYRMVLQQLKLVNMKNKRLKYNNGGGLNFTAKNVGGLDLHFGGSSTNVSSATPASNLNPVRRSKGTTNLSTGISTDKVSFRANASTANRGGGLKFNSISGQTNINNTKISGNLGLGKNKNYNVSVSKDVFGGTLTGTAGKNYYGVQYHKGFN